MLKSLNVDFEGIMPGTDQDIYDIMNRKAQGTLEAQLGDNPEPELRGDTTFGLNPKWIDWYCATHHTAVWKARKVGKAQLRKLNELKARFNK